MKNLIKLEELFLFGLSIFLFSRLDFAWWWFLVLFLAPDLSMLGYLHNAQTGAIAYNLAHHKGAAIAIFIAGVIFGNQTIQLIGLIIFGHSSLDRVFGYGLKYPDSFEHTHLGMIGKNAKSS